MTTPGPKITPTDWTPRLASLVHAIRHDWDEVGVASVLRKVADRPLAEVALAAVACALERTDQHTPACIALDGHHWRLLDKAVSTATESGIVTYCAHGEPGTRCPECHPRTHHGTLPTPEQRAQMRAAVEDGKAAIKALETR